MKRHVLLVLLRVLLAFGVVFAMPFSHAQWGQDYPGDGQVAFGFIIIFTVIGFAAAALFLTLGSLFQFLLRKRQPRFTVFTDLGLFVVVSGLLIYGGVTAKYEDQATISDDGKVLALLTFKKAHEFLAEYDREITLYYEGNQKTLPYPPDTGGDAPISVSRHKGGKTDFLRFESSIYTLVFDLKSLDYAVGSDRPENEIYSGKYTGVELPDISAGWVIDRDRKVTETELAMPSSKSSETLDR